MDTINRDCPNGKLSDENREIYPRVIFSYRVFNK